MITFPDTLTMTKYPGYYWCTKRKKLFSIKIGGELRELRRRNITKIPRQKRPGIFLNNPYYYIVSVNGARHWLTLDYLLKLKRKDFELPLKERIDA